MDNNQPNINTVEKIASLAHLELSDSEKQTMLEEFKALFAASFKLPDPLSDDRTEHAEFELPLLRKDTASSGVDREMLLESAKEHLDGYFTVPRAVG